MSLEQKILNSFMSDAETILEDHIDDLEGTFQFHEDGSIELLDEYREIEPKYRLLLQLIARRYQYEAGIAEDPGLNYDEVYPRFPDKSDSTVRNYFMNLREDGFARNSEHGNEVVVERLPEGIDLIKAKAEE